ncbi:ABC transporter substrate-binding protein [Prosthecochloris sp. GSB1]|nr:ABC transporter substrate-binding protein [Prosthecochloris sp. GSB1]
MSLSLKVVVMLVMLLCADVGSLRAASNVAGQGAVQGRNISVVTSILPLSFFARRVGGERVKVAVMVPPGGNPHSYEPTPAQMVALGKADLFVKAGSGIEFELDWMKKFTGLYPRLRVCNASEGVRMMALEERALNAHGHDSGRLDPHFWLSPANGIIAARNIERALSLADPSHAGIYEANRIRLENELRGLSREIAGKLSGMKERTFMVFHPAWGYYAREFGLRQLSAEEEGKELTPKRMRLLVERAKRHGIRVVFVSPRFNTMQAEAIAREIGGVTRSIDPLSDNYIANLRKATDAFVKNSL